MGENNQDTKAQHPAKKRRKPSLSTQGPGKAIDGRGRRKKQKERNSSNIRASDMTM